MAAVKYLALVVIAACASKPPPAAPAPTPAPAPAQAAEHGDHGHPHEHQHHHGQHRFEKADDWAPMFDDPKRDAWQQPDRVVTALSIALGMSVADVGAGTGYFAKRLAAAVGPKGAVIAIDIEPDMVRYLRERAQREGTPNVEARLAKPDDPALAAGSVDRILIVNTWHHIADRVTYGKKLAAALKPGGFVFVVDFTRETEKGPPREHRLPPEKVIEELQAAGLRAAKVDAGLPDQYVVKGERR